MEINLNVNKEDENLNTLEEIDIIPIVILCTTIVFIVFISIIKQ